MKKLLLTVSALAALTMLAPTSSFADSSNGYMGLYFPGTPANGPGLSCAEIAFVAHKTIYIVALNPVIPGIKGFECGIDVTSPTLETFNTNISVTSYAGPAVDIGNKDSINGDYNFIVGYNAAVPVVSGSLILATLDVFYLESAGDRLELTLRAAIPPSHGTPVPLFLNEANEEVQVAVTQDPASPTLIINPGGDCEVVLPSEDMSFGGVKSLFR